MVKIYDGCNGGGVGLSFGLLGKERLQLAFNLWPRQQLKVVEDVSLTFFCQHFGV